MYLYEFISVRGWAIGAGPRKEGTLKITKIAPIDLYSKKIAHSNVKYKMLGWWLRCCFTSHSTIFQPYMWRQIHVDVQVDWRRSWTYRRAQCNRHFIRFLNVPVQEPTRGHPFHGHSEYPDPFYCGIGIKQAIQGRSLGRTRPWSNPLGQTAGTQKTVLVAFYDTLGDTEDLFILLRFLTRIKYKMQYLSNI